MIYTTLNKIEWDLLREIKVEDYSEKLKQFRVLFDEVFSLEHKDIGVVCFVGDNKTIVETTRHYNNYLLIDSDKYKIGELFFIKEMDNRDREYELIKIELTEQDLKELKEQNKDNKIQSINNWKQDTITKDNLKDETKRIEEKLAQDRIEAEQERIRKEDEEKEAHQQELNANEQFQNYTKNKCLVLSLAYNRYGDNYTETITINKNELNFQRVEHNNLANSTSFKVIAGKDFIDFVDFDKVKSWLNGQRYNTPFRIYGGEVLKYLQENSISHKTEFDKNMRSKRQDYEIEFNEKDIKLNKAKITKNRIEKCMGWLINNEKAVTEQEIYKFSRLSEVMFNFLSFEDIVVCDKSWFNDTDKSLKLPMKTELLKDKQIKLSLLEQEKILNWADVRTYFVYGQSADNKLNLKQFKELLAKMDITIEKGFEKLRELRMMENI